MVPYCVGKLVPPPSFSDSSGDKSENHLQQRIEKDITWSIAVVLSDKENRIPLLGSWTPFPKENTIDLMTQFSKALNILFLEFFVRNYRIS